MRTIGNGGEWECRCQSPVRRASWSSHQLRATRNEKSHLPYGEGTLRAEPLAQALARFDRPATVISESPDEASSRVIRAILLGEPAPPVPTAAPRLF